MKIFFIAAAFFLFSGTLFADNLNLPKIKTGYTEDKVEIIPTGTVVELKASGKKSPANSAAAALAVPGKHFLWTPSELESRTTGGADIYCSLLSDDSSALVVCERIGGAGKPNGLRFIVIDTVSGKIIRASNVIEAKLHYAAMLSDTEIIAAVSIPGDRNEKVFPARIGIIDETVSKGEISFSSADFCVSSGALLYVCSPAEKNITVYSIEDFSCLGVCKIQNGSAQGIALSPDNSKLAVFGGDTVEIFDAKIHNNTLYTQEKYTVPEASFSRCAAVSNRTFVFFSPDASAYVLLKRQLVPMNIRCGEIFAVHRPTETLAIENRLREFEIFRFPELTALHKYAPRKMRPVSRNDNTAVFFVSEKSNNKILLCDHRGNVWKVELNGKRGKKIPVFTVKR